LPLQKILTFYRFEFVTSSTTNRFSFSKKKMSNGNFDNDNDIIMGGTAEALAYNTPASILQTFPCLMAEGREALRQQLEFVTSAVLLHPAEQAPGVDNANAIMGRSKLINDLLTSLYQAAQNLASLDRVNLDDEYRKEIKQVGDMLQETHRQIYNFRLLTNQQTAQQWNVLRARNMPENNPAALAASGVSMASRGRSESPGYVHSAQSSPSVPLAQRFQPAQASQNIQGFQIAGIAPSQSGQSSSSDQSRRGVNSTTSCESRESRRERRRVEKVLRKANKILKRGVKGKTKRRHCRHCDIHQ
jgi:hypothetical protein